MSSVPAPTRDSRFEGARIVLALLAAMWAFEIVDVALDSRLDQYGIEPRDPDGLFGVVAAPFLHAGFGHLIANSIPFVTLGILIAFQGALRVISVTVIVGLVSGLGTWLVAPEGTIHIGASGIVFGYATYLLARGVFNRNVWEILIGVAVAAVWGTALLGGLMPQEGVSWQGHFFGAVGGVLAAWLLARRPARGA
ncbi:MAG TPA: rhomboid family intramembrane serine protease [Thermoleophilaceae bacterium]|nr:rhomboid family intramembrane serine protease [Thermoleophilaceae bacterium]